MFLPFPTLNRICQTPRTTQSGEVILMVAITSITTSCVSINQGFPLYHKNLLPQQGMSQTARCTICTHGGSHAAFPGKGFLEEMPRLVAAPRMPSTNRMYGDRWLCFKGPAAEQGIDPPATQIAYFLYSPVNTYGLAPQTVKCYRSCLASKLSHTCKGSVVHDRIISYMITSMELQQPSLIMVLPG